MKIGIITPVYLATEKVIQCCEAIDKNTAYEFAHILVDDSSPSEEHKNQIKKLAGPNRAILFYHDHLEPDKHRANITTATQMAFEHLRLIDFKYDYLFYVETDVMVPIDWDKNMITLSQLLPETWLTLDALPVDEEDRVTYPAKDHNIRKQHETYGGKVFEVIIYGDWNAILFNPKLFEKEWKFSDVPSHHDILLSRNFRELFGMEREEVEPYTFFRTEDVRAVHYPNSSRSLLPEGMKTPSNPK